MRRIVTILGSTVTALVLLLSYHTSTDSGTVEASPSPVVQTPTPSATSTTPSSTTPSSTTPSSTTPSPTTPSPTTTSPPTSSVTTHTGDVVQTRWGPVQVRISVRAGKITASEAVHYPQDNPRDIDINSYAVPILNEEVVQQQSASVDSVSGATVTSDGYLQSLQSAIDQAHL